VNATIPYALGHGRTSFKQAERIQDFMREALGRRLRRDFSTEPYSKSRMDELRARGLTDAQILDSAINCVRTRGRNWPSVEVRLNKMGISLWEAG
jgi:hypothetical protein